MRLPVIRGAREDAEISVETPLAWPTVFGSLGLYVTRNVPLPAHIGSVTRRAKRLGNRHATMIQIPAITLQPVIGRHVSDACLVWVQSRQQRCARGAATRRVVELRESQSAVRQPVKVRRLHLAAVAAEVGITHVIVQNQQNIRSLLFSHNYLVRSMPPAVLASMCVCFGRRRIDCLRINGFRNVKDFYGIASHDRQLPLLFGISGVTSSKSALVRERQKLHWNPVMTPVRVGSGLSHESALKCAHVFRGGSRRALSHGIRCGNFNAVILPLFNRCPHFLRSRLMAFDSELQFCTSHMFANRKTRPGNL